MSGGVLMSLPSVVEDALDETAVPWHLLIWADFDGDPIYWTSEVYDRTFGASETGDSYLDGKTFKASTRPSDPQDALIVGLGDIEQGAGGSDTLTITLSGQILGDTDVLNIVGDRTKWAERRLCIWWFIRDDDGSIIGGIPDLYYKGRFVAVDDACAPDNSSLVVSIETYRAVLTGVSGRRIDQQQAYDAGDTSPAATVAAANGLHSAVVSGAIVLPGGGTINLPGGFRSLY
jgi:hypothetical protein